MVGRVDWLAAVWGLCRRRFFFCLWPLFSSAALFFPLFGALHGLFDAIGSAVDGDDFGIVHKPVDHGDDAGGIREDVAPFGEGPVGGDHGASLFVTPAD